MYVVIGDTWAGYAGTTDANGHVVFNLPAGNYRFLAVVDGIPYWSGDSTTCAIPGGCTSDTVTLNVPVTVTVQNAGEVGQPCVPVYVVTGDTWAGYLGSTDGNGRVVFALYAGTTASWRW